MNEIIPAVNSIPFLHEAMLVALFVLAMALFTLFIRKYGKARPYLGVFSLLLSKRFTEFIKKGKKFAWLTRAMSDIGLILGFGVFASDFIYGRKRKPWQRVVIMLSTLTGLFLAFNFSFFKLIVIAPMIRPYGFHLSLAFSVFGFSGLLLGLLSITSYNIVSKLLAGGTACPQVGPIIPGIQTPQLPVFIPIYGWIGLLLAMVVHETSHGLRAIGEKIKLKSSGLLLLGFIPVGAFAEPDPNELERASDKAKLRIYAAGPASNLVSMLPLYAIMLLLGNFFVSPAIQSYQEEYVKGIAFVQVSAVSKTLGFCGNPPAPAYGKLEPGMTLLAINGRKIRSSSDVPEAISLRPFAESEFVVEQNGVKRTIRIMPHQETGRFGFEAKDVFKKGFTPPTMDFMPALILWDTFKWAFLISFLLALSNFLPLAILDGGQIASILYPYYLRRFVKSKKKREQLVKRFFFLVVLILVLVNAFPMLL